MLELNKWIMKHNINMESCSIQNKNVYLAPGILHKWISGLGNCRQVDQNVHLKSNNLYDMSPNQIVHFTFTRDVSGVLVRSYDRRYNKPCVCCCFCTISTPAKQQNVSASVRRVFTIPNVIYDVVYDRTKLSKQNIVLLFSRQWIVQFTDNGGCSYVYVHYYYGGLPYPRRHDDNIMALSCVSICSLCFEGV